MAALLAFVPELIDALAAFIGATWWQLPVLVGLWKVQAAVTETAPPAAQQSPAQQAAAGAGAAVGGAGQAIGSFGQFVSQNAPLLIIGGVALVVLTRR